MFSQKISAQYELIPQWRDFGHGLPWSCYVFYIINEVFPRGTVPFTTVFTKGICSDQRFPSILQNTSADMPWY